MANIYGKMMDDAYGSYYERFRILKALSKEAAVPRAELFPEGESYRDGKMMHKMLSSGIVKRVGANKYWLDESVVSNPNGVLLNRVLVIVGAVIFAFVYMFIRENIMQ